MSGYAIHARRGFQEICSLRVLLQVCIQKGARIPHDPRVPNQPIRSIVIRDLEIRKFLLPNLFIPIANGIELRMKEPQHPHSDQIAMRPLIQNARPIRMKAAIQPILIFQRLIALLKVDQRIVMSPDGHSRTLSPSSENSARYHQETPTP